ncbi:MAG: Coenzyme F420 hydrogenase/dehydrogenase, beta subunit C-terminal domain [Clostridia bacterium]|nr:Coenzyme F420 hydrogenase/dehydrogenase, beta subunit C-terminal domain [Clostridia bacterium]
MESIPVLFDKKEDCCGCGACYNACPKNAISMREDEFGYIYPHIDEKLCVRCGKCKRVCAFQNRSETNSPIECYAAVSKNDKQAGLSASGGVFAAIAQAFIESGGVVYGAAFDDSWGVRHIAVTNIDELYKIQGSKYAHSSTQRTFSEVRKYLKQGTKVLYSGTPCQIAGLKEFLGADYDDLFTVDIVCHGVPSSKMLIDYLKLLEDKHGGNVRSFTFRDKSIGWGINGRAEINGKRVKIWQSSSSYLFYFTKGWLYRENCYKCKYASSHRPADITLCDYWGVEKQHPELLGKDGWDESKGISGVIINTQKGKSLLNDGLEMYSTSFEKISSGNSQLRNPSSPGKRDELLEVYRKGSWRALDDRFKKNSGFRMYSSQIKALLPAAVKRKLKELL